MDPQEFYTLLSDADAFIAFLQRCNIFETPFEKQCARCLKIMGRKNTIRSDGDFNFLYRCHSCKNETSIFKNTFFTTTTNGNIRQKLSPQKILKIVFQYFEKKTHYEIMRNTDIKNNNTMVNWCNYIRDVMCIYFERSPKMGGIGKRIQIDESLFRGRRKYHRGRMLLGDLDIETAADRCSRRENYGDRVDGPWIFGMVEEETNNIRMFHVEKRDACTLIPLIMNNIEPGTTIISDGWAAYTRLQYMGYEHEVVIHEENFVDPISGAHTQRIECEWSHAKLLIMHLRRGTTLELLQSHLYEFCFRKCFGENVFVEWLKRCRNILVHGRLVG